jgi:hypothetical protein
VKRIEASFNPFFEFFPSRIVYESQSGQSFLIFSQRTARLLFDNFRLRLVRRAVYCNENARRHAAHYEMFTGYEDLAQKENPLTEDYVRMHERPNNSKPMRKAVSNIYFRKQF